METSLRSGTVDASPIPAGLSKIATIRGNAFVLNAVALGIFVVLLIAVRGLGWSLGAPATRALRTTGLVLVLLVFLVVAHEGIHALVASMFAGRKKVSFIVRPLVVACRVHEVLKRNQYLAYAAAPAAVFAITGCILYYTVGSAMLKFLSALLFLGGTAGGGGDVWFILRVLKYPADSSVLDNGTEVEVYTRSSSSAA